MVDRILVAAVAMVLTILTLVVVLGEPSTTPVILSVSATRGVHVDDLPVLGLYVLAVGACAALWWRSKRRDHDV